MISIFKHLLPRARAWRITIDKTLKQFFEGLSVALIEDTKTNFDTIWKDIDPESTTKLEEWESQFELPETVLTVAERRTRLAGTWQAMGGQDVSYIQNTLQNHGFDVYVHEWWDPATIPAPGVKACVTPRNPLLYIREEYTGVNILLDCGEPLAECGEPLAECGEGPTPYGYPLVNKITRTEQDLTVLCGEPLMECGEPDAECGMFYEYKEVLQDYIVPNDPTKWPYFLYIGGQTFGELTNVDPARRNEFEALCLKIIPCHVWLGMLVNYV